MREHLELQGVPPEIIEQAIAQEIEGAEFEVFAENWTAVQAFLAMQTQWRVAVGMGGAARIGLDYAAIPAVFSGLAIPRGERGGIFAALRIMEAAALPELNRARE